MPCVNHPDVVADLSACSRCGKQFCGDCVITLQGKTICAGCKGERVQDIKSGSVMEDLDMAGRGARLGGAIIDGLVMIALILPPLFAFGAFSAVTTTGKVTTSSDGVGEILLITVFPLAIGALYEALMLTWRGQTLGKMALKLKVVRPDGSDISGGQAWGRAVSRILMSATRILGFIDTLMIFSKPRTTLHDRIAKTRVVNWKR